MNMAEGVLFKARTYRVHTLNRVEATVQLDFGIHVNKLFEVPDMPARLDRETFDAAMHCLIILIGGKRLLIQPDEVDREAWTFRPVLTGRIYLAEKTHGSLVGHTFGLSPETDPVLELAPFFEWVRQRGFSKADVKAAINGRGGP